MSASRCPGAACPSRGVTTPPRPCAVIPGSLPLRRRRLARGRADGRSPRIRRAAQPCSLTVQLPGCLRDLAALIACTCKFVGAGLPGAVTAGDRGGAVRCAAGYLVELHLAGKAVVQADHDHAEM